jgi:excisionase family DNA binding protein
MSNSSPEVSESLPRLITIRQAARLIGITPKGVDKMVRRGTLKVADRVGTLRRVRRSDAERLATVRRGVGRPRKVAS